MTGAERSCLISSNCMDGQRVGFPVERWGRAMWRCRIRRTEPRDPGTQGRVMWLLRWRVRALMIVIALVATFLGLAASLQRRAQSFDRLAGYHFQAAFWLTIEAQKPMAFCQPMPEEDLERLLCSRGPEACRAYRAGKYHFGLYKKYLR